MIIVPRFLATETENHMMSFDDPFDDGFEQGMNKIENMLDEVPKDLRSGLPSLDIHHQGSKTIISNFKPVCKSIRRESKQIKKYISTELGVKTTIKHSQLEISAILQKEKILDVFDQFIEKFITCSNCDKPDTTLSELGKEYQIKCLACGHQEMLSR